MKAQVHGVGGSWFKGTVWYRTSARSERKREEHTGMTVLLTELIEPWQFVKPQSDGTQA